MCTSWCLVSSSVLVGQSFFTSMRLFTLMPRSARRRHYMHQHLQPLSSSSFAPVDLQAFPTIEYFPPPLVPPAVNHTPPPPSPEVLVADCLTQLSGGLIITPATISSPAAVSALQRLFSTHDAQLATLFPTVPLTRFDSLCLVATSSLDIALRSPSSRTPLVAAPASAGPPGGARSTPSPLSRPRLVVRWLLSSPPVAAAPAPAEPPGGARSPSSRPCAVAAPASVEPPGGALSPSSRTRVVAAPASAEQPARAECKARYWRSPTDTTNKFEAQIRAAHVKVKAQKECVLRFLQLAADDGVVLPALGLAESRRVAEPLLATRKLG